MNLRLCLIAAGLLALPAWAQQSGLLVFPDPVASTASAATTGTAAPVITTDTAPVVPDVAPAPATETEPSPSAAPAIETEPSPSAAPAIETEPPVYERRIVIVAARRTQLSSRINAVVSVLHVGPGSHFKLGETLAELDCSFERAQLEEARMTHRIAKFSHESRQRELETGQAPPEDVELTALEVEAALATLNRLREQIKYCALAAPFDGRVMKVLADEHEQAAALRPLLEIVADGPVQFRFFLPLKWLEWLSLGDQFEVEILGTRYPALLLSLAPEADPIDRSVEATGQLLDAAADLLIGVSGRAYFTPPQ